MRQVAKCLGVGLLFCLLGAGLSKAQTGATIDKDGAARLPAFSVPYSELASPQAKANLLAFLGNQRLRDKLLEGVTDPAQIRKIVDDAYLKPMRDSFLRTFPVDVMPKMIGGVQTDVVTPKAGVSAANRNRVLINLHGGAFTVGARYGGQVESIPIASVGAIKVVTVDYRMAPEAHFPAASEDFAKVYAQLLRTYRPENIGVYGCSAGAFLTAQSVAWLQEHDLSRPGAIAMTGGGGVIDRVGDSAYVSAPLGGYPIADFPPKPQAYAYMQGADLAGPLASPADHDAVLRKFPPSLLISGTRDMMLSTVVYTHERLVDLGVDAELHVFEGQQHCAIYFDLPESRQAWRVMAEFFSRHLGDRPR
jgi:monoterpene epsilon-lactone hydrolase